MQKAHTGLCNLYRKSIHAIKKHFAVLKHKTRAEHHTKALDVLTVQAFPLKVHKSYALSRCRKRAHRSTSNKLLINFNKSKKIMWYCNTEKSLQKRSMFFFFSVGSHVVYIHYTCSFMQCLSMPQTINKHVFTRFCSAWHALSHNNRVMYNLQYTRASCNIPVYEHVKAKQFAMLRFTRYY